MNPIAQGDSTYAVLGQKPTESNSGVLNNLETFSGFDADAVEALLALARGVINNDTPDSLIEKTSRSEILEARSDAIDHAAGSSSDLPSRMLESSKSENALPESKAEYSEMKGGYAANSKF